MNTKIKALDNEDAAIMADFDQIVDQRDKLNARLKALVKRRAKIQEEQLGILRAEKASWTAAEILEREG
jgi:uncharacterized protein YdcH (DUF465 family)